MWRKEEGEKAPALAFSPITHSPRSARRRKVIFFSRGSAEQTEGQNPPVGMERGGGEGGRERQERRRWPQIKSDKKKETRGRRGGDRVEL